MEVVRVGRCLGEGKGLVEEWRCGGMETWIDRRMEGGREGRNKARKNG